MFDFTLARFESVSRCIRVRALIPAFALFVCMSAGININAQGTEFTYQGSLKDVGVPANGTFDFEFRLFDAVSGGLQVGSTLGRSSVTVVNGIFSVSLDFASEFPGAPRFLEIKVRQAGGGAFTPLTPRQTINSTPYSIKSETADNATNATTAATATNATQLGGVAATQYVQTGDPRLSDARSPLSGSANYIQNTNTAQTGNFNITGTGTISRLVATGTALNGGVLAQSSNSDPAVTAFNSGSGFGVYATGNTGPAIFGSSPSGFGVRGESVSSTGVYGISENSGTGGVVGQTASGTGAVGVGGNPGSIALRAANGSSWFRGDTTPLSVANTGIGTGIVIGSSGNLGYIQSFDYNVFAARILALNLSGGSVGIGTTAPTQTLDVNGTLRVRVLVVSPSVASVCVDSSNNVVQCGASSLRWKTNIQSYSHGLDVIRRLRPISFNWKQDGNPDIGLGAEEVAKVAPSFAFTNSKGEIEGVKYERLNILLINAVKEQQNQIEAQQKQIDEQNEIIKKRQADFDALKALVCLQNPAAGACKP